MKIVPVIIIIIDKLIMFIGSRNTDVSEVVTTPFFGVQINRRDMFLNPDLRKQQVCMTSPST